jgi:hypothetical protein
MSDSTDLVVECKVCSDPYPVGQEYVIAAYAEMHDGNRVPICPNCSDTWERERRDERPGFGLLVLIRRLTTPIAREMIDAGEAKEANLQDLERLKERWRAEAGQ